MTRKTTPARRRITLERTYQASLEEVWEMWTTPEGIESWWGPDGFAVEVRKLDLRPGGELLYAMTARWVHSSSCMRSRVSTRRTPSAVSLSSSTVPTS